MTTARLAAFLAGQAVMRCGVARCVSIVGARLLSGVEHGAGDPPLLQLGAGERCRRAKVLDWQCKHN